MRPIRPASLACLLLFALRGWCAELVVLVDGAADMPMARFENGRLVDGVHKMLCGYTPEWIEGDFLWTAPIFTAEEVVATDARQPRPASIADLRGQPIGTILGYRHPEVEQILGADFVRDDSPNMEINLEKLARGRIHHILIARSVLEYRQRLRAFPLLLHPLLPAATFTTRCAVSRKGKLSLEEANRAIAAATRDGTLARILAGFR
jgi:ABC-type amino acid transport substrate-binding protein